MKNINQVLFNCKKQIQGKQISLKILVQWFSKMILKMKTKSFSMIFQIIKKAFSVYRKLNNVNY